MERLAYSPRQASEALGIGRTTLYQEIGRGRLKALSLGGRTLITADSLDSFLASLPTTQVGPQNRPTK